MTARVWYGIDRTNRQRTGEARVPKGRWDDVRGSRRLVGGNMDVFQWFLMISTHSQRHSLQIREITAHPGYKRG